MAIDNVLLSCADGRPPVVRNVWAWPQVLFDRSRSSCSSSDPQHHAAGFGGRLSLLQLALTCTNFFHPQREQVHRESARNT
jgi:hypothetical protein